MGGAQNGRVLNAKPGDTDSKETCSQCVPGLRGRGGGGGGGGGGGAGCTRCKEMLVHLCTQRDWIRVKYGERKEDELHTRLRGCWVDLSFNRV